MNGSIEADALLPRLALAATPRRTKYSTLGSRFAVSVPLNESSQATEVPGPQSNFVLVTGYWVEASQLPALTLQPTVAPIKAGWVALTPDVSTTSTFAPAPLT